MLNFHTGLNTIHNTLSPFYCTTNTMLKFKNCSCDGAGCGELKGQNSIKT